jgi:two-component system NtrC family sensor kinase
VKLARKITVTIAAAILAVMAAHGYLLVRQEVTLFEADLEKTAHLRRALRASIQAVWRTHGEGEAQRLVETAEEAMEGVDLRWTWLDAPPGDPRHLDVPPDSRALLARGERVRIVRKDEQGEPWRYSYMPLSVEGARPAVLVGMESLHVQRAFIQTSRLQVLVATIVILVLCTGAVYGVGVRFVGRPLQRLRDKARAIGAGEPGEPLVFRQRDEIGELAEEINAMCARIIEAQRRLASETEARIAAIEQMRHTDRLTTMGQLSSGVAHELGTPLSVIAGRAEMIATGEAQGERAVACARAIGEQAELMTALIRQLLDFSRRQGPRFGLASLRVIAARTVDLLASFAGKRGVSLELDAPDDPMLVSADQNQLQQVLTNVIMNAVQAMPEGGRVLVRIGPQRRRPPGDAATPEHDYLCASVEDQGKGISPELLPRVFEPFFTTKGTGEGTGLGLSVAYGIVQEHGGWIDVESTVGKGSRFAIYLKPARDTRARPTGDAS